jgi:hypothetical protein
MTPYELEAWAFSVDLEERPEAFLVVADSFEEHGDLLGAEVRRSWAEQLGRCKVFVKDPRETLMGYCYSIQDLKYHHDVDGLYRESGSVFIGWNREIIELVNDRERPKSAWYTRKGHWNKRKALQKLSIAELVRRNATV